jgi:hypothetical protein
MYSPWVWVSQSPFWWWVVGRMRTKPDKETKQRQNVNKSATFGEGKRQMEIRRRESILSAFHDLFSLWWMTWSGGRWMDSGLGGRCGVITIRPAYRSPGGWPPFGRIWWFKLLLSNDIVFWLAYNCRTQDVIGVFWLLLISNTNL